MVIFPTFLPPPFIFPCFVSSRIKNNPSKIIWFTSLTIFQAYQGEFDNGVGFSIEKPNGAEIARDMKEKIEAIFEKNIEALQVISRIIETLMWWDEWFIFLLRVFTRVRKNWCESMCMMKPCPWAKFPTPTWMRWTSCSTWRNTVIISSNTSTKRPPGFKFLLSCMKDVSVCDNSLAS